MGGLGTWGQVQVVDGVCVSVGARMALGLGAVGSGSRAGMGRTKAYGLTDGLGTRARASGQVPRVSGSGGGEGIWASW